MVATRKPDPLVVPLAGAAGKTFQNDDVTLIVQDVRIDPNTHQTSIELSIRPGRARAALGRPARDAGMRAVVVRPDMHQQQIEVIDAQGRPIHWYPSNFDAEGSRMTLTLTRRPGARPPSSATTAWSRASTEVAFEFATCRCPERDRDAGDRSRGQDEVVPVDDLVVEGRAEGLAGLLGAEAADLAGVGGGVVGQAAGELVARRRRGCRRRPPSRTRRRPRRRRSPAGSSCPISSACRAPASTT